MKQKELQKVKDQVNKVGCGFCVPQSGITVQYG